MPLTHQLVEQDKVFAMFNSLGTAGNLAVRPWLNTMKVPQLFVASGATTWGRDYATYPYSIGFQPSYQAEGWVYGKYLARTAPGATIAVLFQNDDYGKDLLGGLKRGLQRSKAKVIAAQPYDVGASDVSAQIAKLKASGADTLAIFATPNFAVQAYSIANKLGWKPKRVINNAVGAGAATMVRASDDGQNKLVNGTISIAFMKDPNDPQWKTDASMKLYRKILSRYAPGATGDDSLYVYGMAAAWTAVEALRRAGKDLTRESLVKALDTFTAVGNPFLLPGIAVKTAGHDHFPIEQMLLQRWQGATWKSFGGLWGYRTYQLAARPEAAGAAGSDRSSMLHPPARGDRPATTQSPMAHLVSEILSASLADLMAEARSLRTRAARHVLAQGLHPADDAVPRCLRLLHVRATAAPR